MSFSWDMGDGEPPIHFGSMEELREMLDWLSLHGFIEVVSITEDGEFYYGTTEKGRNATAEELTQIMDDEEKW